MPLVKAECTGCGGQLQVDPSKDAAVCPYCGQAYIVEKAIQKYQIHNSNYIQNASINVDSEYENLRDSALYILNAGSYGEARERFSTIFNKYRHKDPMNVYYLITAMTHGFSVSLINELSQKYWDGNYELVNQRDEINNLKTWIPNDSRYSSEISEINRYQDKLNTEIKRIDEEKRAEREFHERKLAEHENRVNNVRKISTIIGFIFLVLSVIELFTWDEHPLWIFGYFFLAGGAVYVGNYIADRM